MWRGLQCSNPSILSIHLFHDKTGRRRRSSVAFQGLADWTDEAAEAFKIKSIAELGTWKYFRWAQAISELADREIEGHREAGSKINLNKALDKVHESKPLKEIITLPPSALQVH